MSHAHFVFQHLRHRPGRSISTALAIAVCIFLLCTLRTFLGAVTYSLRTVDASRLVTRNRVSLMFPLPLAYRDRIAEAPGVRGVAAMHFFGGRRVTADGADFFTNFAVVAEPFLAMFPEILLPSDERAAFLADPRGAIVGRRTAERFAWNVGDVFQLESFIPPFQIGRPFEFVVRGIFDSDEVNAGGTDTTAMYFHFRYLYEATSQRSGVGNYAIQVSDPRQAAAIARSVDALFENSEAQTHTETEAAFRAGMISAAGDLAPILNAVGLAVVFSILLVTANTMSMAVRERRTEIAVLKTLGFPNFTVMRLVLTESLAVALLGGVIGLGLSVWMIRALPGVPFIGDAVRSFPGLGLSPALAAAGLGMAVLIGLGAGFVPALLAYRSRITAALRHA